MGGTALGFQSIRLDAPIYNELTETFIDNLYIDYQCMQFDLIPAYLNKPSFGDADICVRCDQVRWNDFVKDMKSKHKDLFHSNGNTFSIGIHPFTTSDVFQVDFIYNGVSEEDHNIALHYYSNNDLGNLIGKLAYRTGFSYGHTGLTYKLFDEDDKSQMYAQVPVSKNVLDIYEFLGLVSVKTVFHDLNEIYEYVASSKLFHPSIYQLENLTSAGRMRDKKRSTYNGFLDWLDEPVQVNRFKDLPLLNKEELALYKSVKYEQAVINFDMFGKLVSAAKYKANSYKFRREFFNGEIVRDLTGLQGKELGDFMKIARFDTTIDSLIHEEIPDHLKVTNRILEIIQEMKD